MGGGDADDGRADLLALDGFEERIPELARRFRAATPFPHLVLSDLLALDPSEARRLPSIDWPRWNHFHDGYQRRKSTCNDLRAIPSPFRELIAELCAPRFLRFLEGVTGIRKLIPDPHLEGGGLHVSGPSGVLAPHTDFHVYGALDLYRRVNVLLYLNPDWKPDDGGWLTLHDADRLDSPLRVAPTWGTCAVFETNDRSVHGVDAVAEGRWRHSIALYYYTAAETRAYGGDVSTHWRRHGDRSGLRGARTLAYLGLMTLSRLFSMLAHLVNPNFGLRAARERFRRGKSPASRSESDGGP